ncbi:hypothetical protein B7P43_G13108 [Cryptotermes secundus]|uniref:Cytochrome c oxidase subunit 5B, mitochondrial n=1 Tax=Cryptotermes secundus TaxID=105785 RepID=A0A2J7PE36_9NEOP|nr:hypothetical protein B7P43_G13108 [Cryptotermes secundus]
MDPSLEEEVLLLAVALDEDEGESRTINKRVVCKGTLSLCFPESPPDVRTDPYGLAVKRGPGTKDKPNLIPSAFDSRIIGCLCDDESTHINWMWLHKGTASRCGCGYWFKLVEKPAL